MMSDPPAASATISQPTRQTELQSSGPLCPFPRKIKIIISTILSTNCAQHPDLIKCVTSLLGLFLTKTNIYHHHIIT